MEEGLTPVRDGCVLSFRVRDVGPKRLALVHSLGMDKSFWDDVLAKLPPTASVLTYDCRGHGRSEDSFGPYSIAQFADDLADVMDGVGWSSALVGGASMGGVVALQFAVRYPGRTTGLCLIDTTAWYGPNAEKQWDERANRALTNGMSDLVGFQTQRWFTDPFRQERPSIVKRSADVFVRNEPRRFAKTCRMLGAFDLRSALGDVACPTAVVVGREDYATPVAMAEQLHQGISGSSLSVIENGRHLTPIETPDSIAAELLKLLEGKSS